MTRACTCSPPAAPRPSAPTLALAFACALVSAPVRAHDAGLSRGDYQVRAAEVLVALTFARAELTALIPDADADGDGSLGEFELLAIDPALRRELATGLALAAGPVACPGLLTRLAFVDGDGLACDLRFTCPVDPPLAAVTLRWPLLARLGPGHRHLAQLVFAPLPGRDAAPSEPIDLIFHARRSALTVRRPTAPLTTKPTSLTAPDLPTPATPTEADASDLPIPAPVRPPLLWFVLALLGLATLGTRAWRRTRHR